jgi:hypothetical protein
MQYVALLYFDETSWYSASPAERERVIDAHNSFSARAAEFGVTITGGEALSTTDTATTFRRRGDDITITDGPFAETAEQFGGFYILDAPSLDDVLKAIAFLPEYSIEIRPIDPDPGG